MQEMKIDRFKDQFARILTSPITARQRERQRTDQAHSSPMAPTNSTRAPKPRSHKVDICLANPETGEVTTLIEDRMNTYIETKPLRL